MAGQVDRDGSNRRTLAVSGIAEPPAIDDALDDPAWAQAQAAGDFIQRTPRDGEPATQETRFQVLCDDQALYIGVWLLDSDPGAIVDGEAIRDYDLQQSDAVRLIFDTYKDEQNGFIFGTNPAGIEYDGQVTNEGQGGGGQMSRRMQRGAGSGFNINWDADWDVATSRDDHGWYAEFRIPFSTLRYGSAENQDWGFNIWRKVRRDNEESTWSPIPREFTLYRLSSAGTLTGLQPPARRTALLTPYVLGSAERDYLAGDEEFSYPGEFGGELKLQVTQGLTLDLTYNTDFAQVEVDEAQINLTRFPLLFPEKRPFFLENAGYFTVGTREAELFFSRRIGIAEGQIIAIDGGGRISGRVAGFNVGGLFLHTQGEEGLQPKNAYGVARLAREFPNRTRVGAIFITRDATDRSGDYNHTYGIDGQLGIGEPITISSFVAKTETPDLTGIDHAFHIDGAFLSREWRATAAYREIGDDFNAEVGFVPRLGYRHFDLSLLRYLRPDDLIGLREIRPHVHWNHYSDYSSGFTESQQVHLDTHFEWNNGALFSPAFNWVREGLEEDFEVAPGVIVPPGTYDGWEAAWRFNTNESAVLSFSGNLNIGTFLSGKRRGGGGTITYRYGSFLSTSLRFDYNDVDLPEGHFTTRLGGLRLGFYFTPAISLQSLIQYSDQIDICSANVRFAWLNRAGTGLFVVYNEAQGFDSLSGPLQRQLIVKFNYMFTLWGG
ncbi:MAG: carbohydrate binding family 9 domain-containing protein [Gemmatimonadota bacterium]|nr:MAG: carbohydrate binding family 9 domain-containing protein [Gemmatimonadota bacterium]